MNANSSTRLIQRFRRETSGNLAVIVGLSLLPLLGAVALAVDVATWYNSRARLQSAADAAAIATAREMRLGATSPEALSAAAEATALSALSAYSSEASRASVSAVVNGDAHSVKVTIEHPLDRAFSRAFTDALAKVQVSATARVTGSAPICVVGLDESEQRTLNFEQRALLSAKNCAVYSNSTHPQGMRIANFAEIRASLICSSGGQVGPLAAYQPPPLLDCPPLRDPLASRAAPAVGACAETGLVVRSRRTLTPGVYCGGIRIEQGAEVTLDPGLYVIKDGPLAVKDGALIGRHTSFFFTGAAAVLAFDRSSTIDLSAMRDGALAGILFFEDRASPPGRDFRISSDDARNLLGTIYLPRGDLFVNSRSSVADHSAFTVIVARKLKLSEAPVLTLNTNYGATDIPVPDGVGPSGDIFLSE